MRMTKSVLSGAAALALLAALTLPGGANAQTPTPGAGETVKDMPASPHQENLLRTVPDAGQGGATPPAGSGQGPADMPGSPHQQDLLRTTPDTGKAPDTQGNAAPVPIVLAQANPPAPAANPAKEKMEQSGQHIAPTGGGTTGDPAATVTPSGGASEQMHGDMPSKEETEKLLQPQEGQALPGSSTQK